MMEKNAFDVLGSLGAELVLELQEILRSGEFDEPDTPQDFENESYLGDMSMPERAIHTLCNRKIDEAKKLLTSDCGECEAPSACDGNKGEQKIMALQKADDVKKILNSLLWGSINRRLPHSYGTTGIREGFRIVGFNRNVSHRGGIEVIEIIDLCGPGSPFGASGPNLW